MDEQITAKLRTPIPSQLVKKIQGNDYISGQTAIDRLIQATGDSWSFQITNVIHSAGHVAMQGELTIGGFTRTAWGESKSTNNAKEELFKNAETDTLKRCARLFGVALELYGDFMEGDDTRQQPAQRPQTRQNAPQDARPHEPARPATAQPTHTVPTNGAVQEATPRQIKYLHAIAREIGYDSDQLNERCRQSFGTDVDNLDRRGVSGMIEQLQAERVQPGFAS